MNNPIVGVVQSAAKPAEPNPRKARMMLLLVVVLLALPFVAGGVLYAIGWQPAQLQNHGKLITPPQPLPDAPLLTVNGKRLASIDMQGKWWVAYQQQGACTASCLAKLAQLRNVHVAMDKEMQRVKRIWFTTADQTTAQIARQYPDLWIVSPNATWQQFIGEGIVLIDPLGKAMMRFTPDAPADGIRKDLARLLKYSWIG